MKNKKIAICFFGQTRTLKLFDEMYKNLNEKTDKFEFDFFCHTWDYFPDKSKFNFMTDVEFTDDRLYYREDFDGGLFTDVDGKLKEKFGDCHTRMASISLAKVNLLKTKYELDNYFIYDYVVWTRPDYWFDTNRFLSLLEDNLFYGNEDGELLPNEIHLQDRIHSEKTTKRFYAKKLPWVSRIQNDLIFGGTSLAFDKYATSWNSFYMDDTWRYSVSGGHNFHAHAVYFNELWPMNDMWNLHGQVLFPSNRWSEINKNPYYEYNLEEYLQEIWEEKAKRRKQGEDYQ